MKKFTMTLLMVAFMSATSAQTTLNFSFDSVHVKSGVQDTLVFDVNLSASNDTTYMRSLQLNIEYDTAAFGSTIASDVMIEPLQLTNGSNFLGSYYAIDPAVDNKKNRFVIFILSNFNNIPAASSTHEKVDTLFRGLLRLRIPIQNSNHLPGIHFVEEDMNGEQFHQSYAAGGPIQYTIPNRYANDLMVYPLKSYDIVWNGTGWSGGGAAGNAPGIGDGGKDLLVETGVSQALPGNATVRNIIIQDSAQLDLGGHTLTITGTAFGSVGGKVINGIIEFSGSSTQEIVGEGSWENVVINNTNGVEIKYGQQSVSGLLTPAQGTLKTDSLLRMTATSATDFAQIAPGSGTIQGEVVFEMVIDAPGWHNLASPVQGATFLDWEDDILINYAGAPGGVSALYWNAKASDWTYVADSSQSLDGRGFSVYISDVFVHPNGGVNGDGKLPVKLTLSGEINDNVYNLPNLGWGDPVNGGWQTYNGGQGSVSGNDGWNLIPNPYPSLLDFSQINKHSDFNTKINGFAYIWNPATGVYEYSNGLANSPNGNVLIAPMQAFWVKIEDSATAYTSSAFVFDDNDRNTAGSVQLFKSGNDFLRLGLTENASGRTDIMDVLWMNGAQKEYDARYDAFKFKSSNPAQPTFFSISVDSLSFAVNARPPLLTSDSIALGFVGKHGENYAVSIDSLVLLPGVSVELLDHKTGITHDLLTTSGAFVHDTAYDQHRFTLMINNSISIAEHEKRNRAFSVRSDQSVVTVHFGNQLSHAVDLEVIDLNGRVLYHEESISTLGDHQFTFRTSVRTVGFYILRLRDRQSDEVFVEKFLH